MIDTIKKEKVAEEMQLLRAHVNKTVIVTQIIPIQEHEFEAQLLSVEPGVSLTLKTDSNPKGVYRFVSNNIITKIVDKKTKKVLYVNELSRQSRKLVLKGYLKKPDIDQISNEKFGLNQLNLIL